MDAEHSIQATRIEKSHPLEILAFIGIFIAFVLFINSVFSVYSVPYGLDYGEGYLANMSLELVRGHNPYHPINQPPWIAVNYPPLYPFVNGILMLLFGPYLTPGRFIATASFIGIIAISILLFRKLNAQTTAAVLMTGLLLVFPWGVRWAQVVRVDTLGIFFAICGLYFWIKSGSIRDGILSTILLSLAALTKHSFLAASAAVLIYAFFSRDNRKFLLLILLAVLIPGSYLLLNAFTGGGLFLHLITYTANTWFAPRFTAGVGDYFASTWLLQIIAIAGLFMPGTVSETKRVVGWYWLFAHLTLFAYGFEGSDTNYFIEPLLATVLLAGLAFDRLTSPAESSAPPASGLPSVKTIAYALILTVIILGRFIDTTDYKLLRMNPERYKNGLSLINLVRGTNGDILSEDASFSLLGNKQVLIQPYIMSLLARTGKWDQTGFLRTISDQKYSMIIMRVDLTDPYNTEQSGGAYEMAGFDRWTDEMEDAIIGKYLLYGGLDVGVGNMWYLYLPRTFGNREETPDLQMGF